MVSYAYLNEADFSKLAHSAEAWKLLKKKYDGIGDQFDEQVVKRLENTWSGSAANNAFHRMRTVSKQYDDAGIEAHRMGKLMAAAHDEFAAVQKKLRSFQEDVGNDHFKIHDSSGAIEDISPIWNSPTASSQPGWAEQRRQKQEELSHRLTKILDHATQIDHGYAAALRADFNGDEDAGFNKSGYSSDDKALKAQQDADEAAKLMHKDGPLTETELDQLDKLLTAHKGDPEFAARFAQKSGVENTLDKYNQFIDPPPGTKMSDAQLKRIKSLQKHLGSTLGTATRVDSSAMREFKKNLLHAVDTNYSPKPASSPYGLSVYQLTSSLMSHGDWDDELLVDYGDRVIAAENQPSAGNPEAFWSMHSSSTMHGVPPLDPMTTFMDALGHNPGASLEFINGTTDLPNGESIDHLDYLMQDRKWPQGLDFTGDAKHPNGISTLGHALESATTGMSYDYDGTNMPLHTFAQSQLTQELVTTLGDPANTDLIDGKSHLAPIKGSLGEITADYMGDFQNALSATETPTNGVKADLNAGDVTNFLSTVGQDPTAYKAITASQQAYNYAQTEQIISHYDPNSLTTVSEQISAARDGGSTIAGIMSEAKAEAVHDEHIADAKDFNTTVKEVNKWVGRGAGIAIGTIASPAAGAAANWVYADVSEAVVDNIKHDNTTLGDRDAVETYANAEQAHEDAVKRDTIKAAERSGIDPKEAEHIGEVVSKEAKDSYNGGAMTAATRG